MEYKEGIQSACSDYLKKEKPYGFLLFTESGFE